MIDVNKHEVWIFLWRRDSVFLSSEESICFYAKIYVEAVRAECGQGESPLCLTRAGEASQPLYVIAKDGKGKPYFPALPGLHFSLAHSGDFAACAYHSQPVGLDLQNHTTCRREAIAQRFFHPVEYAFLEGNGFEQFFPVWAAKESYVKYTGVGIGGGFGTFCVVGDSGLMDKWDIAPRGAADRMQVASRAQAPVEFYRKELPEGYSLCLCAGSIPGVHLEDLR